MVRLVTRFDIILNIILEGEINLTSLDLLCLFELHLTLCVVLATFALSCRFQGQSCRRLSLVSDPLTFALVELLGLLRRSPVQTSTVLDGAILRLANFLDCSTP